MDSQGASRSSWGAPCTTLTIILVVACSLLTGSGSPIASRSTPVQCIDVGDPAQQGNAIYVKACTGTAVQDWSLTSGRLVNTASGACLSYAPPARAGYSFYQYVCGSGDFQQFSYLADGSLVPTATPSMCVDYSATGSLTFSVCSTSSRKWTFTGGLSPPPRSPPPRRPPPPPPAPIVPQGAACAVQYNSCSPANFTSSGSCPNTTRCPNGVGPAMNTLFQRLSAYVTSEIKQFFDNIGLKSALQSVLDSAVAQKLGGLCGTIDVPIKNGTAVKAANTACAKLPLLATSYYFQGAGSISSVTGCLAVDPCTATFALGFQNLTVLVFQDELPHVTIQASLDVVALSLDGQLSVTSKGKLWDPTVGADYFAAVIVKGHVNVQASADIDITVLNIGKDTDISLSIDTEANFLVNYDPANNGFNSPNHDHAFFIEVYAGGPTLNFGPNEKIDLSKALSISATVNWRYLSATSYKLQAGVTGKVQLSNLVTTNGIIGTVLSKLLPSLNAIVTLQVYVDQSIWGVYLGLTANLTLTVFDQQLLSAVGVTIPRTLAANATLVVQGRSGTGPTSYGAKITARINGVALFAIQFCSFDADCLDANRVCVGIGALSVCVPFDSCTKRTYTRGAGVAVNVCPPGTVKDPYGVLCYPPCKAGYAMVGPVCWQICPSYTTDTGAFCQDAVDIYGKGCCCFFGSCCNTCQTGYTDDGCTCRRDRTFIKKSYGNGVGVPMTCGTTKEQDKAAGPLGLCYPFCRLGYDGIGPVCWQQCGILPPGTTNTTSGGTYCTRRTNGVITVSAAHLCPAWTP